MLSEVLTRVIESPTEDAIKALLEDENMVFWVDWGEEDDAIIEYCESLINTGALRGDLVDVDNGAGFELYINYREKRMKVPLVIGPEDRHITILTLNAILRPEYEIRYCIDSSDSDSAAFLPLSSAVWNELEKRYGNRVNKRFYKPQ